MPWLRGGTVTVTKGSTTVTGINADFAANCRIGDAFVGPDGITYEIGNIASATVISIVPPYKGATAAGAAYAIMPLQGYSKALADKVRDIVNTYGEQLAALKTTGNYDILPASKGGTGLKELSSVIQDLLDDKDATEVRETLSAAKSGANKDITVLSALTTALSVDQGGTGAKNKEDARVALGLKNAALVHVVGTMAAGDIMEVGANANGTYFKFANGLMICRGEFKGYTAGVLKTMSMPMFFIDNSIALSVSNIPSTGYEGSASYWATNGQVNFYSPNTRVDNYVIWVAIGRWN